MGATETKRLSKIGGGLTPTLGSPLSFLRGTATDRAHRFFFFFFTLPSVGVIGAGGLPLSLFRLVGSVIPILGR